MFSDEDEIYDAILDQEMWLRIPSYPLYDASNLGRIRSWNPMGYQSTRGVYVKNPRILKFKLNRQGYYITCVRTEKGTPKYPLVHRLILEAFRGPCPANMEGCHGPDFTPTNNNIDNLRWDTKENNIAEVRTLRGENHPGAKISDADAMTLFTEIKSKSSVQLAKEKGLSQGQVTNILSGDFRPNLLEEYLRIDPSFDYTNYINMHNRIDPAKIPQIFELRAKGLFQWEIAEKLGISQGVVSNYLIGNHKKKDE